MRGIIYVILTIMTLRKFIQNNAFIIIVCLLFFTAAVIISLNFQYSVNPDATSYFTIAREYAAGDIRGAINSYWGPLFSLLLVPSVWFHFNLIIAARILTTSIGVAILIVVYAFLRTKNVSKLIAIISTICLAFVLIPWSTFESITPDVLLAFLLLLLGIQLLRFFTLPSLGNSIVLSVIGALLYTTKGFGFYLFITVIVFCGVYQFYLQRNRFLQVLKRYFLVTIFFIILVAPFVIAISIKSGVPTINNAGDFNLRLSGPSQRGSYPNNYIGPLTPKNNLAISAWETPEVYTAAMQKWNIFHPKSNLLYYLNSVLLHNINTTIQAIYGFGPFVIIGLVILILGIFKKSRLQRNFVVFAAITTIMTVAYCLVYSEQRYLIGLAIFSAIALALTLSHLFEKKHINKLQLIAILILSCIPLIFSLSQSIDISKDNGKFQYQLATSIRTKLPDKANIISNDFASYNVCYFADLRCYNVINPGQDTATYARTLSNLHVNYYLQYDNAKLSEAQQNFVSQYATKIYSYSDGTITVTLYKLRST